MRFLKVILPPLIAFLVFAAIIKYNPLHHSFEGLADIGDGSAAGLIAYYKIFAPFQFVIAVLTQYLIILPLWDKILCRGKAAISIFISMAVVCVVLAFGIAYMIWDRAVGTEHLIHITLFMTGVQLFYWAINFLVMFLFDIRSVTKKIAVKQESETA
ncbi:hypothetical protein HQ865_14275 [Mucilaginibacter mali]|uniref:Uncharacterized protein n=1 Tax=Mucilaginibacter mali TaxID=2740462 RepID=A0A7D4QBZ1_9SPHI|nr:hypothetical protein [Mucilaginibacter mali]QKJ30864.1 hypothetical protein HQ865_14275 [Mucilaginibacter mali]